MAFELKKILSSLNNTTSVFDEGTGEFNTIDVNLAKNNLQLTERSSENGSKNIPAITSSKKDAMAVEIDSYLKHLILMAKDKLLNREKAIDDLSQIQSEGSLEYITEIYENGKADLNTTAKDRYNDLFTARRDWILGEKELAGFREDHKRRGPARFDEDNTKNYGWIFLITIIEIIANAVFLGGAHRDGPAGVFAEILMFGIINIGFSFILGFYIWRGFYHISSFRNTVSGILAVPILFLIASLNLFLAHYRDKLESLNKSNLAIDEMNVLFFEIGSKAREAFLNHPFFLDDFKSYLLMFIGLIASIIAIIKSFQLDDPYPGYGKISREQSKLADSYNKKQTNAFEDMDDLADDFSNQINEQLNVLKGNETAIITRQQDKKQLHEKYNNWLSSVQSVGESLYAFYREENIKARKSKKEPKSFKIDYLVSNDAKSKLGPQKRIVSSYMTAQKTCKKYVDSLNRQSEKYQNMFKDIENMSPDKVLGQEYKQPTVFKS